MRAYCRGCNKEFEVAEKDEDSLIEDLSEGYRHRHPIGDCDEVEEIVEEIKEGGSK